MAAFKAAIDPIIAVYWPFAGHSQRSLRSCMPTDPI